MQVERRARNIAQVLAVRRIHLDAGVGAENGVALLHGSLHADIHLAGGAHGDVSMHAADLGAAFGQFQPAGIGFVGDGIATGMRGERQHGDIQGHRQIDTHASLQHTCGAAS
jgi:hypothetical protein